MWMYQSETNGKSSLLIAQLQRRCFVKETLEQAWPHIHLIWMCEARLRVPCQNKDIKLFYFVIRRLVSRYESVLLQSQTCMCVVYIVFNLVNTCKNAYSHVKRSTKLRFKNNTMFWFGFRIDDNEWGRLFDI